MTIKVNITSFTEEQVTQGYQNPFSGLVTQIQLGINNLWVPVEHELSFASTKAVHWLKETNSKVWGLCDLMMEVLLYAKLKTEKSNHLLQARVRTEWGWKGFSVLISNSLNLDWTCGYTNPHSWQRASSSKVKNVHIMYLNHIWKGINFPAF